MKKQKIFYLTFIIIASLILFVSCVAENNAVDNLPNNGYENEKDNNMIETADIEKVTININPKNLSEWQGSDNNSNTYIQDIDTTLRNGITVNTNVPTADGIEIYFHNETVIKTHDTVKIDDGKIIIAGDSFIDGNGNIIEEGKGKFTIISKGGNKTDINGGNQQTYTGNNADGDALEIYGKSGFKAIIDFLPYMSKNAIDEIARIEYERVVELNKLDEILIAVMSKNLLKEFAEKEYANGSISDIPGFALPYINGSLINELAVKEFEANGFKNYTPQMYPYISERIIDEIAKTEYEKSGFENFPIPIYSYMSETAICDLAVKEFETNGTKNFPAAFASLISTNIITEFAVKEYEKNGLDNMSNPVLTYMNENELDKMVLNEYEKTGNLPEFNGNKIGTVIRPWVSYTFGSDRIFKFNSGAKITIPKDNIAYPQYKGDGSGSITFSSQIIIELPNGTVIYAQKETEVKEDKNSKFIIIIGDGDATIIKIDNTETTVPEGTILDSNGNII